jgi:hypothetical protein
VAFVTYIGLAEKKLANLKLLSEEIEKLTLREET